MARWFLYVVFALASVGAVVSTAIWSWSEAAPGTGEPPRRLRWFVTANVPRQPGTILAKDELTLRLGRLVDGPNYVRTIDEVVGRFVTRPIDADKPLTDEMVSNRTGSAVPPGGAVVPVEVATDHIAALVPGMQLAFATEKELIPTAADLVRPNADPAFTLLAIGPSARKPEVTSLVVAVPKCRMPLVGKLATGSLRPVILAKP